VINADHGLALDESLAAMELEWEARKSIFVADALAWQLHTNGRSEEALEYADEALRLGTRSALFYFHRSEIHRALGDDDAAERDLAEAEAINPNFSILHAAP
jgi:tetratricopeptide (TPR) repeat protein